ncbi:MAG: tRNA (cytidine(34)-2'-O)-methyltransferase [Candidatus Actinomarinaceae bacterium]
MEIVLYQPEIAGNVGACIRLSANTGISLNIIKPFGFSFQENKIRRAGLDYHDLASVSVYENWEEFITTNGKRNIGYLSAKGNKSYWDRSLSEFDYLIFGPESVGLPSDIINNENNLLTIPMDKKSRSINLANSVAIVGYEYLRQQNVR